jgi:hypothetical protein
MKHIAIIIPTRDRPHKIEYLHKNWFNLINNSITTDCIVVLDEDNHTKYPRLDGFIYHIVKSNGIRGATYPLNQVAKELCKEYEYIGFFGDDQCPRTKDWNINIYNKLKETGSLSMVYCNDLLQGKNLSTQIIMDSQYIDIMGFMAPPILKHLYIDNFWMDVGKSMNNLHYLNDVIIEHIHYINNKAPVDELYSVLNSNESYTSDKIIYTNYIASNEYKELIKKLWINKINIIKNNII